MRWAFRSEERKVLIGSTDPCHAERAGTLTAILLGIDAPYVLGVVGGSGARGEIVSRGNFESIIRNWFQDFLRSSRISS